MGGELHARSLLKKGTGTSSVALLGGMISHELGASPLLLAKRPRREVPPKRGERS